MTLHRMAEGWPSDDERRWEILGDDEVLHQGWVTVSRRVYRLPDGRVAQWEMVGGGQSVGVLALTPEGHIVCVRQFRPGPDRVVLNIPGGFVEPGETPEMAGVRELTEETGYVSDDVTLAVTAMSASSTGKRHVVIARDCRLDGLQALDEYEDCEPVVLPVDTVRRELRAGQMTGNELVYLALDHADLL